MREFRPVATPLNDLGAGEYIRFEGAPTGFTGGLYPNGSNSRPPAHESAGLLLAHQITPLNNQGTPDAGGKIVLISIGMSNASREYLTFMNLAENDPDINPNLVIVNGAQEGRTSDVWADPAATVWQVVNTRLNGAGVTPAQVQVAWVKDTRTGVWSFPQQPETIQSDFEAIARNLTAKYPNLKIAYFSSRTRSYTYWIGLSPEPAAYESAFSVKWMVEKQINGDPSLNFNATHGAVVAPYLAWGPYLWADGENPRSDGLVWVQSYMADDCTHPSDAGRAKVAAQLMAFFKTDTTAVPWFLANVTPARDTAVDTVTIAGNIVGVTGSDYTFSAAVSPVTATIPITYTWQATDLASTFHTGSTTDAIVLQWANAGFKQITVTARNTHGSSIDSRAIFINPHQIYLPIIIK